MVKNIVIVLEKLNLVLECRYYTYYFDEQGNYVKETYFIKDKLSKKLASKSKNLDTQRKAQNALLRFLGGIDEFANHFDTPASTTVEEFMNRIHMYSSRKKLLLKLEEILKYEDNAKVKRR